MARHQVTAFIGPSGCGKSTLLRCFNRMNDLVESARIEGSIRFNGDEVNESSTDVICAAAQDRHGLPAVQPLPQVDL